VSEVVTVSEAPSAVNTETSVVGRTVDNRTLNDLPIFLAQADVTRWLWRPCRQA
jgi:hypothetical protein